MKRHFTLLLLALLFSGIGHIKAQTTVESEAGKLSKLLAGQELVNLTISGQMNADDFGFLRDQKSIKSLNLLKVEIVKGGSYEANAQRISTQPNVMPAYFLFQKPLAESLETLTLPRSVTLLDKRALQGARKLTSLILPSTLEEMGELAVCGLSALTEVELPASVKKIGPYAFWSCTALSELSLPEGLKEMGHGALQECRALSEIALPQALLTLPSHLFKGCEALETVEFSEFLQTIEESAFEGCKALTQLPDMMMLTEVGERAFKGCTSLEKLNIRTCPLKKIADNAFADCSALTSIQLPASIEIIGPYAFYECSNLEKVGLPSGLKTIYGGAFAATALKNVVFPEEVAEIAYGAFAHCTSLTTVHLPAKLKKLSNKAFGGCKKLKQVSINAAEPPVGDLEGLADIAATKDAMLIVPKGSKKTYTAADGWKAFSKIEEDKPYNYKLTAEDNFATQVNKQIAAGELTLGEIRQLKLSGLLSRESLEFIATLPMLDKLDLSDIKITNEENDLLEWNFGEGDFHAREISFPKEYVEIPSKAFANCVNLRSVRFISPITSVGEEAFAYCSWLEAAPSLEKVTSLGDWVFVGCGALQEVVLPEGYDKVPDYAFFACTNLSKITLGKTLTTIGNAAFANCIALPTLELPGTVEEIGKFAFLGSEGLKELKLHCEEPPTAHAQAFSSSQYKRMNIMVKKSKGDAILNKYKKAEIWKEFKNYTTFSSTQTLESTEDIACHGGKGCIVLDNKSSKSHTVNVYELSGLRVAMLSVAPGKREIACESGVYIVSSGGEGRKIVVF